MSESVTIKPTTGKLTLTGDSIRTISLLSSNRSYMFQQYKLLHQQSICTSVTIKYLIFTRKVFRYSLSLWILWHQQLSRQETNSIVDVIVWHKVHNLCLRTNVYYMWQVIVCSVCKKQIIISTDISNGNTAHHTLCYIPFCSHILHITLKMVVFSMLQNNLKFESFKCGLKNKLTV